MSKPVETTKIIFTDALGRTFETKFETGPKDSPEYYLSRFRQSYEAVREKREQIRKGKD